MALGAAGLAAAQLAGLEGDRSRFHRHLEELVSGGLVAVRPLPEGSLLTHWVRRPWGRQLVETRVLRSPGGVEVQGPGGVTRRYRLPGRPDALPRAEVRLRDGGAELHLAGFRSAGPLPPPVGPRGHRTRWVRVEGYEPFWCTVPTVQTLSPAPRGPLREGPAL